MQVSLDEVLADNYFGPGWTAADIVGSIIDDLNYGRFDDEALETLDCTRKELGVALTRLVLDLFPVGYSEGATPTIINAQLVDVLKKGDR